MAKQKRDLTKLDGILEEILETKPSQRLQRMFHLATGLAQGNAETCYQGLMAERCLMQHEADLLQMLAQRLGKDVMFQHAKFVLGQPVEWREGRWQDG